MKLVKLTINNFRGLKGENNVIDFTNSNIIFLIGQNNVGKSTYLRAYEYFTNPKTIAAIEDFYNHTTETPIIIEGWFVKEANDENNDDFQGTGKTKDPDWANKWVGADGLIKIKKIWGNIGSGFEKYTFSPEKNDWIPNGFGGIDTLFTKYAPQPITISAMEDQASLEEKVNKLIQDDFIKKAKETYPEDYSELIQKVKDFQSKITGSESVENLNAELNKHFQQVFAELTLKIQASKDENIKIEDAFKKNHFVIVERKDAQRKETFLQNGHGVIRQALFNFLAFLKKDAETNRKQYIILFEEPEVFLHPKIAFKLRESLYELAEKSPYQILCSTHSPLMIDISKPHSSLIRVVKDDDETTATYQVGDDIFGRDEEQKERVQMINKNQNTTDNEKIILEIIDNGQGMTKDIIKNVWFTVATPNKEKNKAIKIDKDTRRTVSGEKGLGRLSTASVL